MATIYTWHAIIYTIPGQGSKKAWGGNPRLAYPSYEHHYAAWLSDFAHRGCCIVHLPQFPLYNSRMPTLATRRAIIGQITCAPRQWKHTCRSTISWHSQHLSSILACMPCQDDVLLCQISIIDGLQSQRGLTNLVRAANLQSTRQERLLSTMQEGRKTLQLFEVAMGCT